MKKIYSLLSAAIIAASAHAELTTDEGVAYTVTPDPEVEQTSIKGNIVITFPEFTKITGVVDAEDPDYILDIMATFTTSNWYIDGVVDGNTVTFTPWEPALVEGEYTLSLLDGLTGYTADGDAVSVAAFSITWVVTGEELTPGEYTIIIDPAEGQVDSLCDFTMEFDGATVVSVMNDYAPANTPTLYSVSADGTRTKKGTSWKIYPASSQLTFSILGGPFTADGDYVLVIPAGFLFVDGVEIDTDLEYYYTIGAGTVEIPYTVEFSPADGSTVDNLDNIRVITTTTQDGVTITRNSYGSSYPKLYLLNADGSYDSQVAGKISGDGDDFMWSAYYGDLEDGDYAFVVPADYVTLTDSEGNSVSVPEMIAYYKLDTTSGISAVGADNAQVEWYTLQGVKLNSAPKAGVYIMRQGNTVSKVIVK
ncbi:MAG: hypothetical protein LUD17_02310 [Bacteroidales bacterium]|nr:hypothetical protein [Bacteroidales bacterium]